MGRYKKGNFAINMKQLDTDIELVKNCLRGDINSQKRFYLRFAPKMLGVCLRYSKSKQDAEDILQEGFIKVFEALSQFNESGSLEGWVRKVIVNVALQHLRKKKIMYAPLKEVETMYISDYSNVQIFQRFEVQDLLEMMNILPSGARVVFNLYVFEELSHKEIAEKLNITISTSKSQLYKARNLLKTQFQTKKIANDK